MSGVLHEIRIPQEGDVDTVVQTGLHLAGNLASQVQLTAEDLALMKSMAPRQIMAYVQEKYHRSHSITHLYGWDLVLLDILTTMLCVLCVVVAVLFLWVLFRRVQRIRQKQQ
jgi:hypothetical protein